MENVLACAKHFPGHGDTSIDSHLAFPIIKKALDDLEQNEILPFIKAMERDVKSIMVGHLIIEEFDDLPASLSEQVIDYLRGYDLCEE